MTGNSRIVRLMVLKQQVVEIANDLLPKPMIEFRLPTEKWAKIRLELVTIQPVGQEELEYFTTIKDMMMLVEKSIFDAESERLRKEYNVEAP